MRDYQFKFWIRIGSSKHKTIYGSYLPGGDSNIDRVDIQFIQDLIYISWWGVKKADWVCKDLKEVLVCMNLHLGFNKTALFLYLPNKT